MEANCTLLHSSPNLQVQSQVDSSVRDTAAKRHGAVAVQSPADQPKPSGAYHPDVQECRTSLSSTPISFSRNEHTAFASESWSEFYMRQLLHFDLGSQDKEKDESTHSGRKHWSLEDLKLLLQEREKFWQPETKGQVESESSLPGSRRNDHKASSVYEVEDADGNYLKRLKQMVFLEEVGKVFVEDNASLDTKFIFPGPLDEGLNTEPEFQHTYSTSLARLEQTTLGNTRNAGSKEGFHPCSDTWKCPEHPTKAQGECFSSLFQIGPLEQEADLQLASGAGRDKVDDDVVMSFAEDAQLQHDIYDHFATQALDAAYDAIMHPEEETLKYVWDYAMQIPLSADSFESNPVYQDVLPNRVPTDKASLHCPWEAVADTSHGVLSSHGIMEQGLIGIPRDFWRRNRLY
ncbi:uncharacterized protein CDV56_104906 [Aspergillus thermomutatus]|uniref:Uncharacterized protein n=1 Tax=Aspergillus thermomutatus TaxID=41047 RepID=A0A397GAN3_ASPTH|nr:uncharacterized protein CDV56_104906 [Aspergillus thermomutatus]RHZ46954.1 hypothetical protein CDV56_104906 [Aspergillus thermomutatus]